MKEYSAPKTSSVMVHPAAGGGEVGGPSPCGIRDCLHCAELGCIKSALDNP
jgi:hypothetical protein